MDEPITLALTLPRPLVLGGLTLLGVIAASWLVYLTLPEAKGDKGALHKLSIALGLGRIHPVLMLAALTLYIALTGILILGLFGLIIATLLATGVTDDYLFYILRIGGLTAVLGAVIAFPFTLIRLGLSQESLFNDKINEATKGLYARRQVTIGKAAEAKDHWQDDIVQRNAAIDRLEGLAQEKPTEVPRIARLLSVYVRELSAEVPAQDPPNDSTPDALQQWAWSLPKLRSDMEKAAQTLGRLADIASDPLDSGEIDLRGANLQRADLRGAKLEQALLQEAQLQGANLYGAQLQGAILYGAQLQGANLYGAQLQGAILYGAQLQGADLSGAQLQRANLFEAQLQGADLSEARFEASTFLTAATLRGAAVRNVDFTDLTQFEHHLDDLFGDASVTPPNGARPGDDGWPDHWADTELRVREFYDAWHKWQATLPPGRDNPD